MRSTTLIMSALVALAEAASVQKCAGSCVIKGIQATGCSSVDSSCICSSDAFLSTVHQCVPSTCTEADVESAIAYAQDFCRKIDLAKREALPIAQPKASPQGWGGSWGGDKGSWGGDQGGWGGEGHGEGGWGGWWDWWKNHPEQWGHGHGHGHPRPPPSHHHKPAPTHVSPHPKPTNTVIPSPYKKHHHKEGGWPHGWGEHEGGWGEGDRSGGWGSHWKKE